MTLERELNASDSALLNDSAVGLSAVLLDGEKDRCDADANATLMRTTPVPAR